MSENVPRASRYRDAENRRFRFSATLPRACRFIPVATFAALLVTSTSLAQSPRPRTSAPNDIEASLESVLRNGFATRPLVESKPSPPAESRPTPLSATLKFPRITTTTPTDIARVLSPANIPSTQTRSVSVRNRVIPVTGTPRGIDGSLRAIRDQFGSSTASAQPVRPPAKTPIASQSNPSSASHHALVIRSDHQMPNVPAPVSHGPFDGQLDPYRVRATQIPDQHADRSGSGTGEMSFGMWWEDVMTSPIGIAPVSLTIDMAGVTETALEYSPYVKGILTEPQIRRTDIVVADAEFDSLAFIEAKFADTSEPVGSALITGDNSDRFRDETYSSSGGLRKKTRYGGSLELAQRAGFQDNNSTFLDPNPQGTTRLEINFTQPLMKDGGRAVNNTRILLAQIDTKLASSEVRSDLEDHLVDVARAYWQLYQARAEWLQRNRLLEGAERLHDVLVARDGVDSLQRQILRAQVAVTSRRSDLIRAVTRIRNAQSQLRTLTGSPHLIQASHWELTPQDRPLAFPVQISSREATITALDNRPDITQSIRKIHAVSARVGAARNQVMPRLDLILSTYVAGLDAGKDSYNAFVNQFSDGRPSYAAGLLFEVPIGNRASKARLARNRLEMTRAIYEFQQTTEVAFTDVEVAVRETHTTFDEMATKKLAIDAAQREVDYLQQRWELLPDPNESAILLIEDLLDAQERLADEERAFVTAQVAYALSWVQLRKAMGVLLRLDNASHSPLIADEPSLQDRVYPGASLR